MSDFISQNFVNPYTTKPKDVVDWVIKAIITSIIIAIIIWAIVFVVGFVAVQMGDYIIIPGMIGMLGWISWIALGFGNFVMLIKTFI